MSPFQFRCGRNQAGTARESVVWRCRDGSRRLRSRHGGSQTRDGCQAANRRLRISAVPLRGGTTAAAHLGTSHRRHGPGAGRKAEQTARQVSRRPRRTAPRAVRRGKVAAAARGLRRRLGTRRTWRAGCDARKKSCRVLCTEAPLGLVSIISLSAYSLVSTPPTLKFGKRETFGDSARGVLL